MQKCTSYDSYQAKRRPRCICEACWGKWVLAHPDKAAVLLAQLREAAIDNPETFKRMEVSI